VSTNKKSRYIYIYIRVVCFLYPCIHIYINIILYAVLQKLHLYTIDEGRWKGISLSPYRTADAGYTIRQPIGQERVEH
jgi:hypothetical protein